MGFSDQLPAGRKQPRSPNSRVKVGATGSRIAWRLRAAALLVAALAVAQRWGVAWTRRLGASSASSEDEVTESPPWAAMAVLIPPDSGYQLTEHFVTTPDGFILRLFRLQYPAAPPPAPLPPDAPRPAVLLQHALMDSSALYVLRGPGKSLGFVLASQGYDVWMANLRGNRFSRNHTHLDPDTDAEFWSWSWDEHAALDLPAMVGAVLNATGAASLQYIGYSQGTTMALAALSAKPDVAARIDQALLLAPVGFVGRITSLPFVAMAHLQTAEWFQRFGVMEFAPHDPHFAGLSGRLCAALPGSCIRWMQVLCGANPAPSGNIDPDLLPAFMQYLPSGTSVLNMAHWSQAVRSLDSGPQGLRMYDFGTDCPPAGSAAAGPPVRPAAPGSIVRRGTPGRTCNQLEYGQPAPPSYDLSRLTTPLALFTGGMDALSDVADVELLLEALPPGIISAHHHYPDYGHLDYGIGVDAPERLYSVIVDVLRTKIGVGAAAA